jgi:hypothetical protein
VPEFRESLHVLPEPDAANVLSEVPTLNPLVYRIRQNQTAALPFDNLGITNCKSAETQPLQRRLAELDIHPILQLVRLRGAGRAFNGNVPNYHGLTEFITARRANALSQLTIVQHRPDHLPTRDHAPALPSDESISSRFPRGSKTTSASAR